MRSIDLSEASDLRIGRSQKTTFRSFERYYPSHLLNLIPPLTMLGRPLLILSLIGSYLSGCSTVQRLNHAEVHSLAVGKKMAFEVWAPEDLKDDEQLPLVVFLHGGGDSEEAFDKAQVGQYLDAQLRAHHIPRVVIVVPRGEFGFWENWHSQKNNYRDWVIKEVIPTTQAEYHTLPCPEHCHVAGVSMGGHGTLRFAWYHPEVFSSASALSAPIFDTNTTLEFTGRWYVRWLIPVEEIWGPTLNRAHIEQEDLYRQWTTQADLKGVRLLIGAAAEDRREIVLLNQKFHDHLATHDIEHAYVEFDGAHNWVSWTPVIKQILRFAVWGQTHIPSPP